MRGHYARLAPVVIMGVALTCGGLPAAAVEEVPMSLISYDGERPVALAPDDPLAESVGVLFLPPEEFAKIEGPMVGYATAFLVSECYALAAGHTVNVLPVSMRFSGGSVSVIEPIGLRFGLGLKPGSDPDQLTEAAFRTSWPVTIHKVLPEQVQNEFFEMTHWWLLHLEGCETGAKENGKPIAFDPVSSLELQEAGLPVAARHVGALLTDHLSLMELPKCQLLGAFRSKQWESTCSSWLGMAGGPVLTYDKSKKAWIAIGFIPQPNFGLLLSPIDSMLSGKRVMDVYKVEARNPRYFHYTTRVVPIAQVWPWIRDSIEGNNPGLIDPRRADIAELKVEQKKLLLMQMQQKPRSEWSAFDYTRFGLGLEAFGMTGQAFDFYKSAIASDPAYAPAALEVSQMLDSISPRGISEAQLRAVLGALGDAVDKYPEDPQLILRRIAVERKLALYDDVLADGAKYMKVEFKFKGSSPFYVDRGEAFLAVGDLKGAEAAFAEAYQLDALNAEAMRGLTKVKLYGGDTAGALRLAEKAVLVDPNSTELRLMLATARARAGDIDGAISGLEEGCEQCLRTATPYVYLAVLRGYRRAVAGDTSDSLLITQDELGDTYSLWPRPMADVFTGTRSLESLANLDHEDYIPEWRRWIAVGQLVFASAYELSQGRTIDYPALEQKMLKHRDVNYSLLAPILKDWADRVAARKQ
jgi:tetratricopeptide (TPR) repeat protein